MCAAPSFAAPDGPRADGSPIIQVVEVAKEFVTPTGATQDVLHEISFDIQTGELVCLLGPTGCGKTTVLNMIAGFDTPSSGQIKILGEDVKDISRQRVVVFQDAGSALFGWCTVIENVEYPLKLRNVAPRAARLKICRDLLALVHLAADEHKFPYQLSGGGKQRLQIARALAADPTILLMDEPLAALDALTKAGLQREIVDLVTNMRKTVLYVTHDIIECALISHRVIILSEGPAAVIRCVLENTAPYPRSVADEQVASFIRELEGIVLSAGNQS
jgi:NitT/TauT family transport system ATP-binding protein